MSKNIILFGGGNQLQYSIDIIEKENKFLIIGIIDSIAPIGKEIYGYKVIGRQENIAYIIQDLDVYGGIITVGDNWSRKIIYDSIIKQVPAFNFVNAIHPSVILSNNVTIGKGVVAMAGCIFNTGANVGDFTFFATGAQIEHDCDIQDFASVSAGCVMGGHVKIGKYSAITLGVIIIDRVNIGENTVVGSGALVLTSLPDNVLAYGNPARVIKIRERGEKFLK